MAKILDCTLRDGGYYTNWDFDKSLVNQYLESTNNLPIDYLEVGYRSIPMKGYLGKYFYCPIYELEDIRKRSLKKIVIILNEKDIRVEHIKDLLGPIVGLVDMVRIAIDPEYLGRALVLAEGVKKLGFEVGFNVMYMSKWKQYGDFIKELKNVDGIADYFYMVDSYGGVYPEDVIETMNLVRENTKCKLGFHGHNNLELALINSLTAISQGIDIIDATIWGMGRGAGNLKTELLLTALNSKEGLDVDFNALGTVVNSFDTLLKKYEWGTNLPYMISGSNSLPQKDVMDWVTTRFYSFNSIIQALQNQKAKVEDNERLPIFESTESIDEILIIGGGKTAVDHAEGVMEFILSNPNMTVIHASSKNASHYNTIPNKQVFCLVGNEGHRMEQVFDNFGNFEGICVLPPFPRKMGTYIPSTVREKCFELPSVEFTDKFKDSHTALALQTAIFLNSSKVFIVGYDGYQDVQLSQKERDLTEENETLFSLFNDNISPLTSLTPSVYKKLKFDSVYSYIYEK
ncbi:aldolase catalytic domain-containing protein [Flectobacillus rivi]|uniref:Aldolase catalytic domain-containing protein n=1 Tax=Flectobacillus rivi TaxID=2984209 RepID=A0ABT6YYE0_9BACT|nr:aldolase catalytic domain-containing protein [Flectobacillus rivi]MDI9873371.1 aldolase catalytic domain-containing protein [Flectobacillus rivi]